MDGRRTGEHVERPFSADSSPTHAPTPLIPRAPMKGAMNALYLRRCSLSPARSMLVNPSDFRNSHRSRSVLRLVNLVRSAAICIWRRHSSLKI